MSYPGYYGPREYYRGRRRRRSPFDDMNLASLGKLYTDVPVTAVQTAMEGLNTEYRRVADYKDNLEEALASAQVMEGDSIEKQNLIKGLQDQINTFVEDTGGAFERGDQFVRGLAKDVSKNPWLYQAIDNKKKFDEDQKVLDEMRVQGLAPIYYSDPNFTTMGADGTPQTYQSYIGSTVDRRPALESFFKNLKANKGYKINQFFDVLTSQDVSQPRIDAIVNSVFDDLTRTKEYQQSLENAQAQAQFSGQPFDKTAFDDVWKSQLQNVGNEFVYNQEGINLNTSYRNALMEANQQGMTLPTDFGTQQIEGDMRGAFEGQGESNLEFGFADRIEYYSSADALNNNIKQEEPRLIQLPGKVIDLTDAKGNLFTGGRFEDKPADQSYLARRTGRAQLVPVVADMSAGAFGLKANDIAEALKAEGLEWNAKTQEDYANQLPYSGQAGGFAGGTNKLERSLEGFIPKSINVNGQEVLYLQMEDSGALIIEQKPKVQYEAFQRDGKNVNSIGFVLSDPTPIESVIFNVGSPGGGLMPGYRVVGGVTDFFSTKERLNQYKKILLPGASIPEVKESLDEVNSILGSVNAGNQLTPRQQQQLDIIREGILPEVIKATSGALFTRPTELTKLNEMP
jgi:hypothetical protein